MRGSDLFDSGTCKNGPQAYTLLNMADSILVFNNQVMSGIIYFSFLKHVNYFEQCIHKVVLRFFSVKCFSV